MNSEIIESFFISNGSIFPSNEISNFVVSDPSIYEVVRVIDGVPLFFDDHLTRLEASASSLNVDLKEVLPAISEAVYQLIKANKNPDKNIKLIVYNLDKSAPDYIMSFIRSSYPNGEQYNSGVHTILVHEERQNPNAKIINNELREKINTSLKKHNAYEALLVNNRGEITEGSRSNLFFVEDGKVYTAPTQDVLIGITRKYIIRACSNLGLEIVEQPIPFSMLEYAEGAFITGTSPKILPIASIDEIQLNSAKNSIVSAVLEEYDAILKQYISEHK